MSELLVDVWTDKISMFRDVLLMLEGVSCDDINIIFKKNKSKSKSESENSDSKEDKDENQTGYILFRTINNNQTSISVVKLESCVFKEFYLKKKEQSFWINVKELNLWFKSIETDDYMLNISINKEDKKTFNFMTKHTEKQNKFKKYNQSCSEPDIIINSLPEIKYDFGINISTSLFKKICNDMKKFSEFMEIYCDENQVVFKCITKYNKENIASYENSDGDIEIKKISSAKSAKACFYLDQLLKLKFTSNICDYITLFIKNKNPLMINSQIEFGEEKLGKTILYFSPYDKELTESNYHDKMKEYYNDKLESIKSKIE